MKKTLIISSSPRKGGNSDILCDRFMLGATESGHEAEKIRLAEMSISYCSGCGYCNTGGVCSQNDDMKKLHEKLIAADVIVFATPVYFYTMCGQMKTFIDRCCAIYSRLSDKEFYYILTAADNDADAMQRVVSEFRGFTEDCLENPIERGIVYGVGAWNKGDIIKTAAFKEAYELGKKI